MTWLHEGCHQWSQETTETPKTLVIPSLYSETPVTRICLIQSNNLTLVGSEKNSTTSSTTAMKLKEEQDSSLKEEEPMCSCRLSKVALSGVLPGKGHMNRT